MTILLLPEPSHVIKLQVLDVRVYEWDKLTVNDIVCRAYYFLEWGLYLISTKQKCTIWLIMKAINGEDNK